MYKVLFVLMAIGVLAFSASQPYARPNQLRSAQRQLAELGASSGAFAQRAAPAQPLQLQVADGVNDAPAPALLIYLGCILVGSLVGVGLVRRSQREAP